MVWKHEFQSVSVLMAVLLFVFPTPCAAVMSEGTAMQLAHAELVRVAGYGDERLSTVLVTGTLLCSARMHRSPGLFTSNVPGAKVAVACKTEGRRELSWAYGLTDDYGEFIVDLPSHLHANPKLEEDCIVRVLRVPKKGSFCDLVSGMIGEANPFNLARETERGRRSDVAASMARSGLRSASFLLRRGTKSNAVAPAKRSFSASAHDDARKASLRSLFLLIPIRPWNRCLLVAIVADETAKWEKITYAGIVTCTTLAIYNLSKGHPHHEEPPAYPYLHIRNKEFPWGPDSLFEKKHADH
ncbi:unnamed protein product [Musa acuminata var. zebrina]